jgi:hypothetical protein
MKKIILQFVLLLLCYAAKAQVIVMEYFYDTDPGVGNGIQLLPSSTYGDSIEYSGAIVVPSSLATGYHTLFIRSGKMVSGNISWGLTENRTILIYQNGSAISAMEYFYDNDPGVGNGTPISITPSQDSATFSSSISTIGLLPGLHKLFVRAKDVNNRWGLTEMRPVEILTNGSRIANAEYFFDTDPGVGNGFPISLASSFDTSSYIGGINTTGLSAGLHTLNIRMKEASGLWGSYETRTFTITKKPIIAEYFVDTDPGVGNGTSITLTDLGNGEAEATGGYPISSSIPAGVHTLYIRTMDNSGQWGLTNKSSFTVLCTLWYRDMDGDAFGNPIDTLRQCTQPVGYVNNALDCNDNDALEKPGQIWYIDADGDDYSTGQNFIQCTRPPNGYVAAELLGISGDCNDFNIAIHPGLSDFCNGIDDDCDGLADEDFVPFSISLSSLPTTIYTTNTFTIHVTTSLSSYASVTITKPNSSVVAGSSLIINNATSADAGVYTATIVDANGCSSTASITISILNVVVVNAKVVLGGPLNTTTGLMDDSLRVHNLIPLIEPYTTNNSSSNPYATIYSAIGGAGGETAAASIFTVTGNNAIVDWVFLELRSAADSTIIVSTHRGLLQRDGDIVSVDGINPLILQGVSPGNYFVVVKHRNHLGVMTKFSMPLPFGVTTIDFSSPTTALFSYSGKAGNPSPLSGPTRNIMVNGSVKRVLYGGNCNLALALSAYRYITFTSLANSDRMGLFNFTAGVNTIAGYSVFDCNMDGISRFNGLNPDRQVISTSCANNNSVITQEQIP